MSDGRISRITLIDTAGQERFRSLNKIYLKMADSCIILYDITNRRSFEECKYFIHTIKELCKSNIKGMLIGNKLDLYENQEVSTEEGRDLANSNNLLFSEISCMKNINIIESFEKLIEASDKDNISKYEEEIVLKNENLKKQKCCK